MADVEGNPLPDVVVKGATIGWVETSPTGFYELAAYDETVGFRKQGYRPVTKIVQLNERIIDVALEEADGTEWVVPVCSESEAAAARIGETWRFLTFGARFQLGSDGHHGGSDHTLNHESVGGSATLRYRSWHWCCAGKPLDSLYVRSQQFNERAYVADVSAIPSTDGRIHIAPNVRYSASSGLDAHGVHRDGTRWRWVGPILGMSISYEQASEESAQFFDRIINSMCYAPPSPPK